MFWFNKNHPETTYMDIRRESIVVKDSSTKKGTRKIDVDPDILGDFREIPFSDESYNLVVFDPPHLNKLGKNSWLAAKYGRLLPTWEDDISQGFNECMRVLKKDGVLIFKWNENQININKIIKVLGKEPLFGHKTKKTTHWLTFIK